MTATQPGRDQAPTTRRRRPSPQTSGPSSRDGVGRGRLREPNAGGARKRVADGENEGEACPRPVCRHRHGPAVGTRSPAARTRLRIRFGTAGAPLTVRLDSVTHRRDRTSLSRQSGTSRRRGDLFLNRDGVGVLMTAARPIHVFVLETHHRRHDGGDENHPRE